MRIIIFILFPLIFAINLNFQIICAEELDFWYTTINCYGINIFLTATRFTRESIAYNLDGCFLYNDTILYFYNNINDNLMKRPFYGYVYGIYFFDNIDQTCYPIFNKKRSYLIGDKNEIDIQLN